MTHLQCTINTFNKTLYNLKNDYEQYRLLIRATVYSKRILCFSEDPSSNLKMEEAGSPEISLNFQDAKLRWYA